jgi:RNA-binding protein
MPNLRRNDTHPTEKKEEPQETMITSGMKRRLKREFSVQQPTVWVGKEGVTQQVINEINKQLEQHEVVKARIHQTALINQETKQLVTDITIQTNSTLIDLRGHTFILYKKRRRQVAQQNKLTKP